MRGPLGRWRAASSTFYYTIFKMALSIVKLNKKNKGDFSPLFLQIIVDSFHRPVGSRLDFLKAGAHVIPFIYGSIIGE